MDERHYNVLFICTGNSARSIMAEVIMNHLDGKRFKAFSAGTQPRGEIHPTTLRVLSDQGYSLEGLRSKSWEEFANPAAIKMDYIFTLCDQAAGEACPAWPGQPVTAHWGFTDPTQVTGTLEEQARAFWHLESELVTRLRLFMDLPVETLDKLSLQTEFNKLGRPEG